MKVLILFGTRPEAIKMVPVIYELNKHKLIQTIICVTAQHRQMLDQVLEIFKIVPDYDLEIMKENQSLMDITINILSKLDEVIKKENPDLVLVHGDTTSTFIGALTSFYNKIEVVHIEAGLRTNNVYSPFPEEMNRVLTDCLSTYYFAPTIDNKENLLNENKDANKIFVTGNTVIDTLKLTIKDDFNDRLIDLAQTNKVILLTAHRRENLNNTLDNIFKAIKKIVEDFPDILVIYPVHLNPTIRKKARMYFNNHPRIKIVNPIDVVTFHNLMNNSYLIVTDSGGIQEEATYLGKPVILVRDTTERKEGLKTNNIRLVGVTYQQIYYEISNLLTNTNLYNMMNIKSNVFGDGFASKKIVEKIIEILKRKK